jgi:DNA-binding NtrC family response regulator
MHARLTVESGMANKLVLDFTSSQGVRLGRKSNNTLVFHDKHASRLHAEIFFADERWWLKDCGTTNGTMLNGVRIDAPAALRAGDEIGVGDTRLRFTTDPAQEGTDEQQQPLPPPGGSLHLTPPTLDALQTAWHADELTALFQFMNAALQENTPRDLVTLALHAAHKQTAANVAGYLSLDAEGPFLKVVVPSEAQVDTHLSRQLTQQAAREGRSVWLSSAPEPLPETESLAGYRDAVCVPLRTGRAAPGEKETPLGAMHVYRSVRPFTAREVRFCEVLAGCLANALHVLQGRRALEADYSRIKGQSPWSGDVMLGDSPALRSVRRQVEQLADCPCSVVITGESGVGKELVALGLHRHSRRRDGPLVSVNCGAIPRDLAEAELFGSVKGAYTGATADRPGYFQQADDGTLFLDEIGELPPECQVKLLRVLETKSVQPVGGVAEIKVDVRVLAATNRDLEREVKEGHFRKDLFYRLGAPLKVPPLREHAEDIPALVAHFLAKIRVEFRRRVTLSEAALQRLQTYSWPGNVRQLRSVLEMAVAMTEDGATIHAGDLHLSGDDSPDEPVLTLNLEELEAATIRRALSQTGGNNTKAAQLLGINRDTLINKIKKYGIQREVEKGPSRVRE